MIVRDVPINDIITGRNIRTTETSTTGLSRSLKHTGLLQPITVQEVKPGKYEIITGYRRFVAAQAAGEKTIPAIIRGHANEIRRLEEQIAENIQRENLTSLDEATAYDRYLKLTGVSMQVFASRLGISPSYLSNILSIARNLTDEEKAEIRALDKQPTRESLIKASRATNPEYRKLYVHGDTKGVNALWLKNYRASPDYQEMVAEQKRWRRYFRITLRIKKATVTIDVPKKRVSKSEVMTILSQAKIQLGDIKKWPPT